MSEKNSQPTTIYPTNDQHERWKAEADARNMSLSGLITEMTEAGLKKFNAVVAPDKSRLELRDVNRDLKDQLKAERERVEKLENKLLDTEASAIEKFVRENPGASYAEVLEEVQRTAASRTPRTLDAMAGETLTHRDGGYYVRDDQ